MAWTWTDRGGGTHNTSALSFTFSPAANFTAGTMAVLGLSVDNSDSAGALHSTFTVTDTLGNTWTRRTQVVNDPGAASAGVEGAIFTTAMDGGTLTTGTTITVTFDANCTAKVWMLFEASSSVGTETFVTSGTGTGSGTTPSITTGTITSGDLVVAACHTEYGTSNTFTADADTTNGTWSAQQTARVGTTASGMGIAWQSKETTATATQTYDPGLSASCDYALSYIVLRGVTATLQDPIGCGVIPWAR